VAVTFKNFVAKLAYFSKKTWLRPNSKFTKEHLMLLWPNIFICFYFQI